MAPAGSIDHGPVDPEGARVERGPCNTAVGGEVDHVKPAVTSGMSVLGQQDMDVAGMWRANGLLIPGTTISPPGTASAPLEQTSVCTSATMRTLEAMAHPDRVALRGLNASLAALPI